MRVWCVAQIFAQEGLRTLVLGYRDLDAKEFEEWQQEFKQATFATQDRAEKLSMVRRQGPSHGMTRP